MNHNEQGAFLAGCKHTRENIKIMSVPVMITREQADKIVVNDLIQKYKHNLNNENWAAAFRVVISYYLDEQEMAIIDEAIERNSLPEFPLDILDNKEGQNG